MGMRIVRRLLIGSQNGIKRCFRLGVDRGQLSADASESRRELVDGRRVVRLNCGRKRLPRGGRARLKGLARSERTRKDRRRLGLLSVREAQRSRQKRDLVVDHRLRIGRRAAISGAMSLCENEGGGKCGRCKKSGEVHKIVRVNLLM